MKTVLLILLTSTCSGLFLHAQDLTNFYVPIANLNGVINNGKNYSAVPFTFDINKFKGNNMYWSFNGDCIVQLLVYLYMRHPEYNFQGGILHFRYGYAFWQRHFNSRQGLAIDLPIRTCGYGLGATWFLRQYIPRNELYLIPQVSSGILFFDPIVLGASVYASVETDFSLQLSPTTGIAVKPFFFATSTNRREFGVKIGFCRYTKPKNTLED